MTDRHHTDLKRMRLFVWLSVAILSILTFFAEAVEKSQEKTAPFLCGSAREVFEHLQTPALEILSRSTRLDMLDYYEADSIYYARNLMEGKSNLDTVAPGYLRLHPTAVSTFEIKLLPMRGDTLIMTLYTVGAGSQAPDTEISFYNRALTSLPSHNYFPLPALIDFLDLKKKDAPDLKQVEEIVPFPTMEFNASADSNDITGRLTAGLYLSMEDRERLLPLMRDEVVFVWTGSKYKQKK